jgi:trimethylamine--corrinoid protein Co-methyltransferase
MIDTIMRGVEVSPETLALDVMEQVGAGGSFFGEPHTARHFRENWFPKLMNRGNYDQWMDGGGLSLGDKANARVRRILNEHQPEPLPETVIAELDKMEEGWWRELS